VPSREKIKIKSFGCAPPRAARLAGGGGRKIAAGKPN
jgi:hypothetical protein